MKGINPLTGQNRYPGTIPMQNIRMGKTAISNQHNRINIFSEMGNVFKGLKRRNSVANPNVIKKGIISELPERSPILALAKP
jgi:hypothetical protein